MYRTVCCEDFSTYNSMENLETYEKEIRLFGNDCTTDQRQLAVTGPETCGMGRKVVTF